MATITITIPDAAMDRVLEGFALAYGHPGGSETKADFARRMLVRVVKDAARAYEVQEAVKGRVDAANSKVDSMGVTAV